MGDVDTLYKYFVVVVVLEVIVGVVPARVIVKETVKVDNAVKSKVTLYLNVEAIFDYNTQYYLISADQV